MLSNIAPVREIFDFEQLEFDEIMQRDIDDARVSSELIPYLLDPHSSGFVKLFPPIIVVVLPIKEDENRPAKFYPSVEEFHRPARLEDQADTEYLVLRAGKVGQEVFQFQQPLLGGKPVMHDLVRLKLNTNKTRLVIVDGQHRAMALLALYRNLKDEWSNERRAPYKDYYAEWTSEYIRQFNLKEINLPVMLCTFPELDAGYSGDFDLRKAARSIFLTLNKTARKVSDSRNILLDDSDLIAHFLRLVLSKIKDKGLRSQYSLRIHNLELDQVQDRTRLHDRIAVTGVNHIYYIIEHLLLNQLDSDVKGAKPRSGHFVRRKDLASNNLMERLNGRNRLGAEVAEATARDLFTTETAKTLGEVFFDRYGRFVVGTFERFVPFEHHNRAVLALRKQLDKDHDRKLIPIIFEGQGIGMVFDRHRANLREKLDQNYFESDVPEIQETLQKLDATAERIKQSVEMLRQERTDLYLSRVGNKSELRTSRGDWHPTVAKWLDGMYDNVFTTVAFQAALVCGFFGEIEHAYGLEPSERTDVETAFDEYIGQVSRFFVPESAAQFKRLYRVFDGEIEIEGDEWQERPTNRTFRDVVYRGEMKPDQWPKYKYLILEVWKPQDVVLANSVRVARDRARRQVFISLYKSQKEAYCKNRLKLEESLTPEEFQKIFNDTYSAFEGFIKNVGGETIRSEEFKKVLASDFETANEEESIEAE